MMGMIKYQRGKAGEHRHVYVLRPDGPPTCACGAVQPPAEDPR